MKLNWKTLSLGSLSAIALIATPLAFTHLANAQGPGEGIGGRSGGSRGGHFEQLNLTEEQSTQIEAIRTDARSQMQAILTPEQQAATAGESGPRAWRSLDLSEDQRSQMQVIRDASKEKTDALLTAEQRQQLEQMHAERGERGGPGGRGDHLEQLNLTEEQSTQIQAIRTDTRSQMQAILTPEQQAATAGESGPRAWRSLDLSEEQRSQMQAIRDASKEKIDALLTDEQRQQLEQMHEQRGDRQSSRQVYRQAAG
jgi:periplasmic protein CpxP/Spy